MAALWAHDVAHDAGVRNFRALKHLADCMEYFSTKLYGLGPLLVWLQKCLRVQALNKILEHVGYPEASQFTEKLVGKVNGYKGKYKGTARNHFLLYLVACCGNLCVFEQHTLPSAKDKHCILQTIRSSFRCNRVTHSM